MASKSSQVVNGGRGRTQKRREILGILLVSFAVFSGLSLISMQVGRGRLMGPGGAATAAGLYAFAGLGAYLVNAALLLTAVRAFRGKSLVEGFTEGLGALLLFGSVTMLLHLPFAGSAVLRGAGGGPGGMVGEWLGELTAGFIGSIGAALAATSCLFVALLMVTNLEAREVAVVVGFAARVAGRGLHAAAKAVGRVVLAIFPEKDDAGARDDDEEDDEARLEPGVEAQRLLDAMPDDGAAWEEDDEAVRVGAGRVVPLARANRSVIAAVVAEIAASERVPSPARAAARVEAPVSVAPPAGKTLVGIGPDEDDDPEILESRAAASDADEEAEPPPPPAAAPIIVEPSSRSRQRDMARVEATSLPARAVPADGPGFIKLKDGAFELPATELLVYKPPQGGEMDKQSLYDMAERLEQAMSNYGVRGKVKEIHMGPVVTMFEFAPAPGTRTGKIANLEKDLAMALEAQAVRIVAPIPGKAVVGVEVPNKTREMVYLREILEDDCFTHAGSKLQVALGKDIKGAPVSVNLAKMPHLLVAGTTGSGKSVAINGMIVSLLYNASPEDVRFIMVDPKMLELSIYEGIPHLLLPVVTDPKKANLALRWAVDEMERRYELLAKAGVRDIVSYNTKLEASNAATVAKAEAAARQLAAEEAAEEAEAAAIRAARGETAPVQSEHDPEDADDEDELVIAKDIATAPLPPRKLPYIVIVIDEFADLMMVAPKDVETSVARIAQKARAAGLHLILATQRPSVDVITGLIKANFPSRIALQVASRIDSRTILDQPGADTLLGNGDMLFSDRGLKLRRVHGAFLSDDEVHRVVDHLKVQAKPVYDMDILKPREEDAEEDAPRENFHDDLYDQAVAIVCDTRQASVSYVQRRLQIGYNRAARMVEQMERDGIVGPANGAKPRDVLAPAGEYLQAP